MVGAPAGRLLLGRQIRLGPLQQAAEHPDAIDQQTGVGRIVAATLGDGAIHPQAVPAGQVVLLRQDQHPIVHPMQRLGPHKSFQIVLGGMIRHGMLVHPDPALIGVAIAHRFFGLAIGPFLPPAQEGQAVARLERDGPTPLPRAFVMSSQVASVKCKQLGILEDPIQFLQDRVARFRRDPIDRTCVTLYNHGGPPRGEDCLGRHPLIPSVASSIQLTIGDFRQELIRHQLSHVKQLMTIDR